MLQAYYRRGAALTALARYEEALAAFCACAVLERGPRGPQAVRGEVTRVLHRLLVSRARSALPAHGAAAAKAAAGGAAKAAKAAKGMAMSWRAPPACSSDCEDNSSDDDCYRAYRAAAVAVRAPATLAKTRAGAGGGLGRGSGTAGKGAAGPPLQDLGVDALPADPYLDALLDRVRLDVEKLKSKF